MNKFILWFIVLIVLFVVGSIITSTVWNYGYSKNYEYALKLADDASLPQDKAKYLTEYLNKVSDIKGTPRYIFMTPDLELDTQRVILQGLITRFNDIAKIRPSEMAYQQGMQQLTGQEMDHQLSRIKGIFRSAKLRENFILFLLVKHVDIEGK